MPYHILSAFNDINRIANYAKESIALTVNAGIVNGYSNKSIAPNDLITRAEFAAIVERLLTKSDWIFPPGL